MLSSISLIVGIRFLWMGVGGLASCNNMKWVDTKKGKIFEMS